MIGQKQAKALGLRTCNADMTSHGGFRWPKSGHVVAPDWNPRPECGNGLHMFLWGEGDGSLANWAPDAAWLVVAVDPSRIIDLGGKVKFPEGEVVFCGDRAGATVYIRENGAAGRAIVGGTATAGDRGTATAGYGGTILVAHWDERVSRRRILAGYIGEDGILPNVPYRIVDGNFARVKP